MGFAKGYCAAAKATLEALCSSYSTRASGRGVQTQSPAPGGTWIGH